MSCVSVPWLVMQTWLKIPTCNIIWFSAKYLVLCKMSIDWKRFSFLNPSIILSLWLKPTPVIVVLLRCPSVFNTHWPAEWQPMDHNEPADWFLQLLICIYLNHAEHLRFFSFSKKIFGLCVCVIALHFIINYSQKASFSFSIFYQY